MRVIFSILIIFPLLTYGQQKLILSAEYIPYPDTSLVYLPEEYNADAELPLLILLHGWTGDQYQWGGIADLKKLSDDFNFIIVCPNGYSDSWYVDNIGRDGLLWETFFMDNLIPAILDSFSIDRHNIFISGLSMGGHGAIIQFVKNPGIFRAAGSTSGILDIKEFYMNDRWGLEKAFGNFESNKEYWRGNSAFDLIDGFDSEKHMIIDCGVDDFAYRVNRDFYDKCIELKINAEFISRPGNHSKSYWAVSIIDHLRFFKQISEEVSE